MIIFATCYKSVRCMTWAWSLTYSLNVFKVSLEATCALSCLLTASAWCRRYLFASFVSLIVCSFDSSSRCNRFTVFSRSCSDWFWGTKLLLEIKRELLTFLAVVGVAQWGQRCPILSQVTKLWESLILFLYEHCESTNTNLYEIHVHKELRLYPVLQKPNRMNKYCKWRPWRVCVE